MQIDPSTQPYEYAELCTKYIEARLQIDQYDALRRSLEPQIAETGLAYLSDTNARDKTIFAQGEMRLSLRFDKYVPKDNPSVQYLQEMIQIELERSRRENAQEIKQLEESLERLRQTEYGRMLEEELRVLKQELTELKPVLVVSVNKI